MKRLILCLLLVVAGCGRVALRDESPVFEMTVEKNYVDVYQTILENVRHAYRSGIWTDPASIENDLFRETKRASIRAAKHNLLAGEYGAVLYDIYGIGDTETQIEVYLAQKSALLGDPIKACKDATYRWLGLKPE